MNRKSGSEKKKANQPYEKYDWFAFTHFIIGV